MGKTIEKIFRQEDIKPEHRGNDVLYLIRSQSGEVTSDEAHREDLHGESAEVFVEKVLRLDVKAVSPRLYEGINIHAVDKDKDFCLGDMFGILGVEEYDKFFLTQEALDRQGEGK